MVRMVDGLADVGVWPASRSRRIGPKAGAERFGGVTRLAKRFLRVPMARVVLADLGSRLAGPGGVLPLARSGAAVPFCRLVPPGDGPLVVADTREDARFAHHPLVTGPPRVRFYAGQPLRLADGRRAGTLCVMDTRPRRLHEAALETLRFLADWAQDELQLEALRDGREALIAERDELRHRSQLDPLTGAWNRAAILRVLERELSRAARDGTPLSVVMADVDHFKMINDTYGHPVGDRALAAVAAGLGAAVRPYDAVGRYGGEEFLAVLPQCGARVAAAIAERMRARAVAEPLQAGSVPVRVTLSLGVATTRTAGRVDARGLVEEADRALYRAKAAGRNRVAIAA